MPAPPPIIERKVPAFAGLDRDGIISAIRRAIDGGRIDLFLQPVVTLPQRKVRYYEALSRLKADNGDLVPAEDFLEYAEAGAAMPSLDHLSVVRCVQVVRRLLLKSRDVGLFCNISGATLTDSGFPKLLEFMEANRAIAPALVFEFTQSAVRAMGPIEHESLAALAERGYRFSIDNLTDLRVEARELNERGFRFVKAPAAFAVQSRQRGLDRYPSGRSSPTCSDGSASISSPTISKARARRSICSTTTYASGRAFCSRRRVQCAPRRCKA